MTAQKQGFKKGGPNYRVMLARVADVDTQPRPADLRPFLVEGGESETAAVRYACEAAVLEGLAIQGKPSLPVDVHVHSLESVKHDTGTGHHMPMFKLHQWSAEVRWRSSGNLLCSAAGTVSRLP